MSPIPINASMGMLLSLAIAFVVTPWLARLWMKALPAHAGDAPQPQPPWPRRPGSRRCSSACSARCSTSARGTRNRRLLGVGVAALIAVSLALPAARAGAAEDAAVRQQVGVPGRRRHARRHAGGADRRGAARAGRATWPPCPRSRDYQAYAGTAAPINFNGLVRQYYLRAGGEVGDLQVNLVDKHQRSEQSHAIATRVRPALQKIGQRFGANVKVVEVPPGPPVLSPIVAEIYGPEADGRRQVAKAVRAVFEQTRRRRRRRRQQHRRRAEDAAAGRSPQGRDARRAAAGDREHAARRPGRRGHGLPARREQVPGRRHAAAAGRAPWRPRRAAAARRCAAPRASWCRSANWSR